MFEADRGSDTDATRSGLPPLHFSRPLFPRGQCFRARLGRDLWRLKSPRALCRRPPAGMSKRYGDMESPQKGVPFWNHPPLPGEDVPGLTVCYEQDVLGGLGHLIIFPSVRACYPNG